MIKSDLLLLNYNNNEIETYFPGMWGNLHLQSNGYVPSIRMGFDHQIPQLWVFVSKIQRELKVRFFRATVEGFIMFGAEKVESH